MIDFNNWFIGFFEGDGSFIVDNKNNRPWGIVINQKDNKVLYYIKNNLKVGTIREYRGVYRWSISRKKDLFYILEKLNGNLLLKKTNRCLKKVIESFNIHYKLEKDDPFYLTYKGMGSFDYNNSWLAGFIDAEGCFNIRIVSLYKKKEEFLNLLPNEDKDLRNRSSSLGHRYIGSSTELLRPMSFRVRLRLVIKLKEEPEIFELLKVNYGGSVNQNGSVYTYTLDSNSRIKNIIDYLDNHNLKSIKHIDFLKLKNTYYQLLNKDHLGVKNITRAINWLKKNNL